MGILYFIGKNVLLVVFQTLFTENCQFFEDFDQNLFLPKLCNGINRNCQKVHHKIDFGHFSSIPFYNLGKKRFWSKSLKKWQFSVNKVWKMTNKIYFPIKYKMLTVYGFHIDFQFWAKMSLPRDLQMDMAPPGSWNGIASWLWDFWSGFWFSSNL